MESHDIDPEQIDIKELKNERKLLLNVQDREGQQENSFNRGRNIGLLLAFLCVLLIAFSKICVQALKGNMPHLQLNTMRCFAATITMLFFLLWTWQLPTVECQNMKATAMYSFSCTMEGLSMYVTVVYIPLMSAETCIITTNVLSCLILFGLVKREETRSDQVS